MTHFSSPVIFRYRSGPILFRLSSDSQMVNRYMRVSSANSRDMCRSSYFLYCALLNCYFMQLLASARLDDYHNFINIFGNSPSATLTLKLNPSLTSGLAKQSQNCLKIFFSTKWYISKAFN